VQTIAFAGVAHIHTPGFINTISKRADVRVKSVWDPDARKSAHRASELNAQVAELDAIAADPEIGAVVVCSETDRHEAIVVKLANARKHLFVEKPLGIAASDAFRMAAAIERAGVLFHTGYFRRGDAGIRKIKQWIDDGTLGTITRIRGSNCHTGALAGWFDERSEKPWESWRWMADTRQSGVGAFGDLGTHLLDILMWFLGPVKAVTATLDPVTNRYPGCDETGEALFRFERGTIATLAAGWVDHADPVALLASGTKGHAAIIHGKLVARIPDLKIDGEVADLPQPVPNGFGAFLDALTGKDVPLVGAREAADRSAVMEAMYRAAESHTWVTPSKS
jgi:predicted dehydrogenase